MSEQCQRCGSVGQDRRTLWMACFYRMDELGLPFKELAIDGQFREKIGETGLGGFKTTIPEWGEPQGQVQTHPFFTLRVCKRCRAEWMQAIADWFRASPAGEDGDADERGPSKIGSGIFVRRNGTNVEISREEWDRMNPGREPVVYKPE